MAASSVVTVAGQFPADACARALSKNGLASQAASVTNTQRSRTLLLPDLHQLVRGYIAQQLLPPAGPVDFDQLRGLLRSQSEVNPFCRGRHQANGDRYVI